MIEYILITIILVKSVIFTKGKYLGIVRERQYFPYCMLKNYLSKLEIRRSKSNCF